MLKRSLTSAALLLAVVRPISMVACKLYLLLFDLLLLTLQLQVLPLQHLQAQHERSLLGRGHSLCCPLAWQPQAAAVQVPGRSKSALALSTWMRLHK